MTSIVDTNPESLTRIVFQPNLYERPLGSSIGDNVISIAYIQMLLQ